jgi:hypothetical protein
MKYSASWLRRSQESGARIQEGACDFRQVEVPDRGWVLATNRLRLPNLRARQSVLESGDLLVPPRFLTQRLLHPGFWLLAPPTH